MGRVRPTVLPNSDVPGIVGQNTLKEKRAVIDCYNGMLYLMGPASPLFTLPPGTDVYRLEDSAAGHLMLPCDIYPNPGMPMHEDLTCFHTSQDLDPVSNE